MGSIWEIDFYSRPVLDENNKKLWEILVCESPLSIDTELDSLFKYSEYCSSSQVNSAWLKAALEKAMEQSATTPLKFRFFRTSMNNMIVKACQDLGIPAQPSRRTLALHQWLQQRNLDVYPLEPGYQASTNPSVRGQKSDPQRLPDALIGQKWVVASLTGADLAQMPEWEIGFGEAFPLPLGEVASDTIVPGVIIYSPRAVPLAGWMSGLEIAALKVDTSVNPARLILETGASDSWLLANVTNPQTLQMAQDFEGAKQKANQVHFLAVQSSPESEVFAGFWLLQEINLP
ncbi:Tab2/Atab2 family RNA-binding protein [Synechocystis sp. PCC 7509]|uniref:Tab2/Atab2 family RNA-binding protein n=1 Tax=Synechocystis sp. PCC 7509 TaxID=927677 RepID=UPI0002AC6AA4|nr:Tab2/Atab2 family RNA-binding protein [Synechocystis sp. PCC 7509]